MAGDGDKASENPYEAPETAGERRETRYRQSRESDVIYILIVVLALTLIAVFMT